MGPAPDPDVWRELAQRIVAGELQGVEAEDAIVDRITANEVMPADHPRLRVEIREQVRAVVRADRELARLLSQPHGTPSAHEPPERAMHAPRARAKKAAASGASARRRSSAPRSRSQPIEPDVESFAAGQLRRRVFSIAGIGIVLAGGWVAWQALQEKPCDRLARKICLSLSDCELGAVRATLAGRDVDDARCEATAAAIDEALVGVDAAKVQGVFARVMTEQLGFDPRGGSQPMQSSKDASKMREPTIVVENVGTLTDLFADEAHLIWTSQTPPGVFRVRSIGGDVEALSEHAEAVDVVATRDFVYWVSRAPSGGTLWTDKKRGEYEPMVIEVEGWSPTHAAFMGPELAFVDGATGAIVMAAVAGGEPRPIAQGGLPAPTAIAADATHVFWATASGSIASAPRDGGETHVLAEGSSDPAALVLDSTHLYWIERSRGTLARVPKRGGAVETLVGDRPGLSDLAIDEARVYATDGAGGVILSIAKADGAITVLAQGLPRPTRIAVDRAALYWEAGGALARLPK